MQRSILYEHCLYFRKLLTVSFPPESKDGRAIIDFSSFPETVVAVVLDMMYECEENDCVDIEIETLLKLANYLHQADCDILIHLYTWYMIFCGKTYDVSLYYLQRSHPDEFRCCDCCENVRFANLSEPTVQWSFYKCCKD